MPEYGLAISIRSVIEHGRKRRSCCNSEINLIDRFKIRLNEGFIDKKKWCYLKISHMQSL